LRFLRIITFKSKRRLPVFAYILHGTIHDKASHTPMGGDFGPSQNPFLGARCGLAADRRQLVWNVSTKLENATSTL
jgi:hypothetical protein